MALAAAQDDGPRIVLGIDYGTTYTGLAWMHTNGQSKPELKDLQVFENWPERTGPKVPSKISYSTTSGRHKNWGFSIEEAEHTKVIQWTKLDLKPRTTARELEVLHDLAQGLDLIETLRGTANAEVPQYIAKSTEDVIRDYLSRVARVWYEGMVVQGQHSLTEVPLEIVITHPVHWSYEALNKTFRAVTGAFHRQMFPTLRRVSFVCEPEACALYTMQYMLKESRNTCLVPGDCIVLCDAGGGTVDLASYRIQSIQPFQITQVGGVSGLECGASFIDRRFLTFLQTKVDRAEIIFSDSGLGGHFALTRKGRIILDRFERVKRAFDGTGTGDIQLPRDMVINENQQNGIIDGVLTLSRDELVSMFSDSVMGTKSLVQKQMVNVENDDEGGNVTNVFLSGGFAENPYLLNEVKSHTDTLGYTSLQRADECWTGVARGAVLCGMGIGTDEPPEVKACPRHYGIAYTEEYREVDHMDEDVERNNLTGAMVVSGQVKWVVRQGDVILPHKPITATVPFTMKLKSKHPPLGAIARVKFIATRSKVPSRRLADFPSEKHEVVFLDIPLKSIPPGALQKRARKGDFFHRSYYVANAEMKLEISAKAVRVFVRCGGSTLQTHTTTL